MLQARCICSNGCIRALKMSTKIFQTSPIPHIREKLAAGPKRPMAAKNLTKILTDSENVLPKQHSHNKISEPQAQKPRKKSSPLGNCNFNPNTNDNKICGDKKPKINLFDNKENIDPNFATDCLMALLTDSLNLKESEDKGATSKNSQSFSPKSGNSSGNKTIEAKPSIRPFTVSIEGNIGSGKSTFLKHFSSFPEVATHQEPLHKWTDVGGHNLLGKLYEDPKRWSFLFQSYVQLTRLNIHLKNDNSSKVKLIERSLHNNRYCFVENGHDSGDLQIGEYNVLCEYFDFLEQNLDLGVDLIVYLRTSPEIVHKRMQQRGRSEESGVPLAYLNTVHKYYEKWLMEGVPEKPPAPVLVIDANSNLEEVMKSYEKYMPVILGKVAWPVSKEGNKEQEQKGETGNSENKEN